MRFDSSAFLEPYLSSFDRTRRFSFGKGTSPLPSIKEIARLEEEIINLFFPGHAGIENMKSLEQIVQIHLETAGNLLCDSIYLAFLYESEDKDDKECQAKAKEITSLLFKELPSIRQMIKLDAQAGFNGDPAAKDIAEIILCYPAIRAIAIHRVAHFLYKQNVPLIPRIMNEVVHSKTGIDIHPGATIGKSFFIDHGTGVVIGETTIIGDNVKLYQGVTLGALSFPRDACGKLLKNIKRHPTIEDDVTIYANATILGDITIGNNTTIAASAWISEDIPANSRVLTQRPKIIIKENKN